jgi:WD40 repeat protein
MNLEEALVVLDAILTPQHLNDLQELIFCHAWEGKTYSEIAEFAGYDANYVKDVGSKLWKLLSKHLKQEVTKSNFRSILRQHHLQTRVEDITADLNPEKLFLNPKKETTAIARCDWGDAVDIPRFYGRDEELNFLQEWVGKVNMSPCRLVAILGMGGIGKTALSIRCCEQLQNEFNYIIWRSLRNAPSLEEILVDLIQFISERQETEVDLPKDIEGKISRLIDRLRSSRCLIVLDNYETILQDGNYAGHYCEGYESYGKLLGKIGELRHQSCLIITSREKPKELSLLEGEMLPVRSLQLTGLNLEAGKKFFRAKGDFLGSETEWQFLVEHYSGNPLALKIVAAAIRELLNNNLAEAVELLNDGSLIFEDIHDLLEPQYDRLSNLEKEVMYWLAIAREPISLAELKANILSPLSKQKLPETLRSLVQRSLIEKTTLGFTQQSVVMDYAIARLIDRICREIINENPNILNSHALIKAIGKDYIRETSYRLILKPIIDKLLTDNSQQEIEAKLTQTIANLRKNSVRVLGYAAGNILNIFCQLKTDLCDRNFSRLTIWQAYLQCQNLKHVNFADSDLSKSVFTEDLSITLAVAFNRDGTILATGDADGQIRLWQLPEGKKILTLKGHENWLWSIAFSPDGKTLVSGSEDRTVRLWHVATGECLQVLRDHTHRVWSVAWSPDGQTLASGSEDCTIRLWERQTGKCNQILQGHENWVRSVAFSPAEPILASSSDDCTIRLWDIETGKCLKILQGHTSRVWSIAFKTDGKILASGSNHSVKLWDINKGNCIKTLREHTNWIRAIAFSPDGKTLASGSEDRTVRLWNIDTGQCDRLLQGHANWIRAIAFSPTGKILASGSGDRTVKLWDLGSGRCYKTLQGHTSRVWSVAVSPTGAIASGHDDCAIRFWNLNADEDCSTIQGHGNCVWSVAYSRDGETLASSSGDSTIKLWDVRSRTCRQILQGYHSGVWSVAFSPNGKILASGSDDCLIRLWHLNTGECYKILRGHENQVWSVAFSPDGKTLASCSHDQTVRLWDVETGKCCQILQGHANWVWTVAFNHSGNLLASGSGDRTIKLWNLLHGKCDRTLEGHSSSIWSVAFSPDGKTLASCSSDRAVKLWDVCTGKCYQTIEGHANIVWSVAFSPDGQILVSGSQDETIRLWSVKSGECLKVLRAEKPYEGMNITGTTGLTAATMATLQTLGALICDR